jgi:preprotein translocase SecE subunit
MNAVITYINDSLEDLRQVRWPTRQQAVRFSAIVVTFTLVSAAFFGLIDFVLSIALKSILSLAA